jgi:hypothetical protein
VSSGSGAILHFFDSNLAGAMSAAEKGAIRLHPMTDDAATTVIAGWRKRVDGALKAVKNMRLPILDNFKRLVIVVTTHITFCHDYSPFVLPNAHTTLSPILPPEK